jgi:hypothetical protein
MRAGVVENLNKKNFCVTIQSYLLLLGLLAAEQIEENKIQCINGIIK